MHIQVTDAPYSARGDGITNDRAAIQSAIDDVYAAGGGTVVLTSGRTFLSGGLILKSRVTLRFGDGATLLQSPSPTDYVRPEGDKLVPYTPCYGHNFSETIKWSHYWYRNYPLLYAPENASHFAICGKGTIRMMEVEDPEKILKLCPIGFYRCHHFEIADVHITNYHSYAIMPLTCDHGLIRNIRITDWNHGNGDGICMMNCRDMRVTGCEMFTGDDSVYIFSSCRDPRKSAWWSSDDPQSSERIEIDHNDLRSNHCKAFGMILWGLNCPDPELIEVRDVYVHDNHIETLGNWLYNPYTDKAGFPPVTHVRFENNRIDGIESNFFETQISDLTGFRSMTQMHNGNFDDGRVFWVMTGSETGVCRDPAEDGPFGYASNGGTLYQGLYLRADVPCLFRAQVTTAGGKGMGTLFVRDAQTGIPAASLTFDNTDWEERTLRFTVPQSGNYRIGVEGTAGSVRIRGAVAGTFEADGDVRDVLFDRGKIIYQYTEELFQR